MIDPAQVTAVIPTRGDVEMTPILATLPYERVIVWDNSRRENMGVYARYAAVEEVETPYVYSQDDDVLFTAHDSLLSAYQPGTIVANMDPGWIAKGGYHDMAMLGAGSLLDRDLPRRYLLPYVERYGLDALLLYEADFVLGTLAPFVVVDLGYRVREDIFRDGSNRLCDQPWQEDWKAEARRRAREIRDGKA